MPGPSAEPGAFAAAIDALALSPAARGNVLTDGRMSCTYAELPALLDAVALRLARAEVGPDDCLAFECAQTLPAALALLGMLRQGQSFALLPPLGRRYRASEETPFVPAFCRFRLKATEGVPDAIEALDCAVHDGFAGAPETVGGPGPKLYLRTSGSTATPKIAVHGHERLHGNAWSCVLRLALGSADRIAIPVPIFHMYGLGAGFLPGVLAGASIDLQRNVNVLTYHEREDEFAPGVAFITPVLAAMLLRKSSRPYRFSVAAGDRLKPEVLAGFEALFGPLLNLYGSTELGAIAVPGPEVPSAVRGASSGMPLRGVEVRVEVDPAAEGETVGAGQVWCRHAYGFSGYVDPSGRPWEGSGRGGDDWFRTGDLGRLEDHGAIVILGRSDHSVNRDGLLVLFVDIESTMEKIEGVSKVVVVASGESRRGARLVAFCVPREGHVLEAPAVRAACSQKLANHAVPDELKVIPALPTLPNGKVDRRALGLMASRDGVADL